MGEGVLLLQAHNERGKGLRSVVLQLLLLSEEDAGDAWRRVSRLMGTVEAREKYPWRGLRA